MDCELKWAPDGPGSETATVCTSDLGSLVVVAHGTYGWRLRWYPADANRVCPHIELADGHASIEELIKLDDAGKLRLAKWLARKALGIPAPAPAGGADFEARR